MGTLPNMMRYVVAALVVAGGIGAMAGAAPAAADGCPAGTTPTSWPGVCLSGARSGSMVGGSAAAPAITGGAPGPVISGGQYGLTTVNGIPCTPEKIGTCIGLIQSQS